MAYKIEDIDWSEMPEGAVEFSLEDEEYVLTWYNTDNRFKVDIHPVWLSRGCDDGRERYKVCDYHPLTLR